MTQIISVSMPDQMMNFIKEAGLSPSKILQDAITYLDNENITSMLRHNKEMRAIKKRLIDFIATKGLSEEYSQYVLEQEKAN